jgi:hypothetical protein
MNATTTATPSAALYVWGCRCWDTKHDRYDVLAYVRETKAEAYAICSELHPTYDIESVYMISEY